MTFKNLLSLLTLTLLLSLHIKTDNLIHASAAAISRVGMIYVDSNHLGYKPFWDRWLLFKSTTESMILLVSLHLHIIIVIVMFFALYLISILNLFIYEVLWIARVGQIFFDFQPSSIFPKKYNVNPLLYAFFCFLKIGFGGKKILTNLFLSKGDADVIKT